MLKKKICSPRKLNIELKPIASRIWRKNGRQDRLSLAPLKYGVPVLCLGNKEAFHWCILDYICFGKPLRNT